MPYSLGQSVDCNIHHFCYVTVYYIMLEYWTWRVWQTALIQSNIKSRPTVNFISSCCIEPLSFQATASWIPDMF